MCSITITAFTQSQMFAQFVDERLQMIARGVPLTTAFDVDCAKV